MRRIAAVLVLALSTALVVVGSGGSATSKSSW
jgi:hypothetical protein